MKKTNLNNMIGQHIRFPEELNNQIWDYANNNRLFSFSEAVRELVKIGLTTSSERKILSENNMLLEKIFSRQIYVRDLLEQLYSDMGIPKLSNPRECKPLQKFKTNEDKIKYDE